MLALTGWMATWQGRLWIDTIGSICTTFTYLFSLPRALRNPDSPPNAALWITTGLVISTLELIVDGVSLVSWYPAISPSVFRIVGDHHFRFIQGLKWMNMIWKVLTSHALSW